MKPWKQEYLSPLAGNIILERLVNAVRKKKSEIDTVMCSLWLSIWKTQDNLLKNFSKQVQ